MKVTHRTQISLRDSRFVTLQLAVDDAIRADVPSDARTRVESGFIVFDWTTDEQRVSR